MTMTYPFTEADSQRAYEEWGANCGPNALAFALQVPLDRVRFAIPEFEAKRYTSPTMMRAALGALGREIEEYKFPRLFGGSFHKSLPSLVRVQWSGPWTEPGANPKWAYRQTHWITTWREGGTCWVFDCNGGVMTGELWRTAVVPQLTKLYPRADGGWWPTHVWRVLP